MQARRWTRSKRTNLFLAATAAVLFTAGCSRPPPSGPVPTPLPKVLFNNDGCDAFSFPGDVAPTVENFLALRTAPLAGSHVETVSYCTISSGFGLFTHQTEEGELLLRPPTNTNRVNITAALIEQGADPLQAVLEWGRGAGIGTFWCMRMNDTHDGAWRPGSAYPLMPQWKIDHPEWLIGSLTNRPRHGAWTAADYAVPAIRERAFRFIREVCRNYDIDGLELDFCRHLSYFPTPAFGGRATDAEREVMTGLMRRIRDMVREEGRRRGRTIPILVRVPDDPEYAAALGLDVAAWMRGKLVDGIIGSDYFRLRPWEDLVALGRRHGVPVYAGLSESRVRGEDRRFRRQSTESYRGRALRAWQAGVDGIYIFNIYNPAAPFLGDIGDRQGLADQDKLYFATVRNRNPETYLTGGAAFQRAPVLTPDNPWRLPEGGARRLDLSVGEEGDPARRYAFHLLASPGRDIEVAFNGHPAGRGRRQGLWIDYPLRPEWVRAGLNEVSLRLAEREEGGDAWSVAWEGGERPGAPWMSGDWGRTSDRVQVTLESGGALRIRDDGTEPGDYFYYGYAWGLEPGETGEALVSLRVLSGHSSLLLSDGEYSDRVRFFPDRIEAFASRRTHALDATARFHEYRVQFGGGRLRVFVDGELRLDEPSRPASAPGQSRISFGAANSPDKGDALWRSVRVRHPGTGVRDAVLSVSSGAE